MMERAIRRISGTEGIMRDIRRILCPVDLSEISRHAIDHAVLLAGWYEASITALHVHNPVVFPVPGLDMSGFDDSQAKIDEFSQVREDVAARFREAKALDIDLDVIVESGSPECQILTRERSLPADLIVMGTHGTGGFQHLVLGSVAEKVLRKATGPVLTVPPRARATSRLPFKQLLCPVDFSDSSLAALTFAFSLAQEGDAELTIVHVLEWTAEDEPLAARHFSVPEYLQDRERDAVVKLRGLVPSTVSEWCHPTTRIAHGKPYREILGIATEEGADLIVMGVHGRNALDLMLFGSTTNQVVRRATCPVLTLRR